MLPGYLRALTRQGCSSVMGAGWGLHSVPRYGFIVDFMAIDETPEWVPKSCSLPTVEQPLRVAEFDRLFGESVLRAVRVSATRLYLVLAPDAEDAARDLAAREVGCCSFFRFDFDTAGADLVMSIGVPQSRADVLDALAQRVRDMSAGRPR